MITPTFFNTFVSSSGSSKVVVDINVSKHYNINIVKIKYIVHC